MRNLNQFLGSSLWTPHVTLPPLVFAIPRGRSSLRPDKRMKDGVGRAWTIPTAFVQKLLKVPGQNDTSGGLIRQGKMRYKPIRTKSSHLMENIFVSNEGVCYPIASVMAYNRTQLS